MLVLRAPLGQGLVVLLAIAVVTGWVSAQSLFESPVLQPVPAPFNVHDPGVYPLVLDVTGDGVNDLLLNGIATAIGNPIPLLCLIGQGGGAFGPAVNNATGTWVVGAADMNQDGNMDLLEFSSRILFGDGTGSFVAGPSVPGYPPATGILWGREGSFGDLDGDGRPEFVAPGIQNGGWVLNLLVWRWELDLGSWQLSATIPTCNGANPIRVGDFNGDGLADILLGTGDCSGVLQAGAGGFILVNDGAGTGFTSHGPFGTGLGSLVTIADVNADGCDDLVEINHPFAASGVIRTFLGHPQRILTAPVSVATACGYSSPFCTFLFNTTTFEHAPLLADMNQDGFLDYLWVSRVTHPVAPYELQIRAMFGRGDGSFSEPLAHDFVPPNLTGPWNLTPSEGSVGLGDVDADGDPDLIYCVADSGAGTSSYGIGFNQSVLGPGSRAASGGLDCLTTGQFSPDLWGVMVELSGADPGAAAALAISRGTAPFSFAATQFWPDLAPGQLLMPQAGTGFFTANAQGRATFPLHLTPAQLTALQGAEIHLQWLVTDPAGPVTILGAPFAVSTARKIVVW